MVKYCRRLKLTGGAKNVRDLGGYAAMDGKVTQFGRFLRSDTPDHYSAEDIQLLLDYGVRTIVDLRAESEFARNPMRGLPGVVAHNFSIYNAGIVGYEGDMHSVTLGDIYEQMIAYAGAWLKDVLDAMAHSEPCILYNCLVGKDRTGIVTAALLSVAGVDYADIVADYVLSKAYMEEWLETHREVYGAFSDAPPEAMHQLFDYLNANYGGMMEYLRGLGTSEETFARIRRLLLEENL